MTNCEKVSMLIIIFFTIWNVWVAFKESRLLIADMKSENFILKDELHSLQHLAVFIMFGMLSIFMALDTAKVVSLVFLEHLSYNLACIFILYPHLAEERLRYHN